MLNNKIFEIMGRQLFHVNTDKLHKNNLRCKIQFNKDLWGLVYKDGVCVYYNKKDKPFVAELFNDYDSWITSFDANYVNYLQILGNQNVKPWAKYKVKILKVSDKK